MSKYLLAFKSPMSKLHPAHFLLFGFLGLILIGTLLFMLPISTKDRHHLSFIDALFEATSAVCVTGLAVVDTGTTFTLFGQIVLLLLIQLGGWGFMTSGILMFLVLGKKIGLKERLLLKESVNSFSLQGLIRLVQQIIKITVIIELAGALILAIRWSFEMPLPTALYYGIFHSISAFNNAGFGLEPDSLSKWVGDPFVNLAITLLFITGGIGFTVLLDLVEKRSFRKLSLHTKLVLTVTEQGKEITKILFETVSAFGTVGLSAGLTSELSPAGRLLITIMMFIGRLGPLTMAFALLLNTKNKSVIRYAEEKILIG